MDISSLAQDIENNFLEKYYIVLQFVDCNTTNDYRCTKCKRVMMMGHIANCSHVFCQNCKKILGDGVDGRQCPSCVKPILKMEKVEDLEFQKQVSKLKVFCPFKINGCSFSSSIKDVASEHLNVCEHTMDKTFPALNEEYLTPEMLEHMLRKNGTILELRGTILELRADVEEVSKKTENLIEMDKSNFEMGAKSKEQNFEEMCEVLKEKAEKEAKRVNKRLKKNAKKLF